MRRGGDRGFIIGFFMKGQQRREVRLTITVCATPISLGFGHVDPFPKPYTTIVSSRHHPGPQHQCSNPILHPPLQLHHYHLIPPKQHQQLDKRTNDSRTITSTLTLKFKSENHHHHLKRQHWKQWRTNDSLLPTIFLWETL